jgi:peptide-methionine (S)-S-oxide reductase
MEIRTMTDMRKATLGGGCFWCLEAVFERLRGVEHVQSGYAGGHQVDPSYREVCNETTGHAEVVEVEFDADQLAFTDLLAVFFAIHDPTTPDRQGNDVGTQYRSIILWHDDEQRREAEAFLHEQESSGEWTAPIVTELEPLETFYAAEAYHNEYYRRNSEQPYCQLVVAPKLAKFMKRFGDREQPAPGDA